MDTAEQIIRDLVAVEPLDGEYGHCTLCFEDEHDPKCPWLRAVSWVQAHPE